MRYAEPVRLLAATMLLYGVLAIAAARWILPAELLVIIALLLLAGATRFDTPLRALLVLTLFGVALLGLADFGTGLAFARPFNLYSDWHFAQGIWLLLKGSAGVPLAVMGLSVVAIVLAGLMLAIGWSLAQWARWGRSARARRMGVFLLLPSAALMAIDVPAYAPVASEAGTRFVRTVQADEALATFLTRAKQDPIDPIKSRGAFLDALGGRDVIVIYIESYGRASLTNPRYRAAHTATLTAIEQDLRARGLAMRSALMRAPTAGGQSWLTHGSVASGLWLEDQSYYEAMLASGRRTLFDHAGQAGYRTVAVKPAHILPWPEGEQLGFQTIYNADDLGYAGLPLNWVTMPDQFTLAAFERLEMARDGRPPILAEISLISSHAPWVPVPEVLDWDQVADGTIFARWTDAGPSPAEVWKDPERIRQQYGRAIGYSLNVVGSWLARHADNPPVVLLMGDHQPLPFVAESDSLDVPVHLIGPTSVVDRLEALGWQAGLIPNNNAPAVRADEIRNFLLLGEWE